MVYDRYKRLIVMAVLLFIPCLSYSQNEDDCPGFRNTMTFNTGSSLFFWSARVGERCYPQSNNDTTTGYYVMSTCADPAAPAIQGHANITSTSYNSGTDGGINCCNDGGLWDANDRRFQIITAENAGTDEFTINNGVGMPRIPPGYQTSIRLGDPRATGQSPTSGTHTWSSANTNRGSEALFYTLRVTSRNALLFVNYAVVGRCYSHTAREAGEFLIRVVKRNDDGTWPNQPVNDSLWFKVSAPALPTNNQPVAPWVIGRPGSSCSGTTCGYVYKPWTKVAINLNEYLYQTVRIEMYTSDCIYNVDPIYAYISGDFQPMALLSAGCPDAESDVIDTLTAPEGMISYCWYVSSGNAEPSNLFMNNSHMDSVSFRQVFPASGTTDQHYYCPGPQDFVISEGDNIGDTVAEKTFLCVMTSAMDPAKPFQSKLYVNVTNTRPIMRESHEELCDGTVNFRNESYCVGGVYIQSDSTIWEIYDSVGGEPIAVLQGDLASYQFTRSGQYTCVLTCLSAVGASLDADGCKASLTFTVNPIIMPQVTIDADRILCYGDTLIARAVGGEGLEHEWYVDSVLIANNQWNADSTIVANDNVLWALLPLGVHPIELRLTDNVSGCTKTLLDTVIVYGTPEVSGISAICLGDSAVITAVGGNIYQWDASPADPALASQQGSSTIVVSPTQSTTYTLRPDSSNPCSEGGAQHHLEVIPTPVPALKANPEMINAEHPVVAVTDLSPNRHATVWHFSDGETMSGESVRHVFTSVDGDSVGIGMHTCNSVGCCSDTSISLPIYIEGVWVPNIFTPGGDINNRFKIIATFPLTDFELTIYDRNGMFVFSTTDPEAGWDGKDANGQPCRQGAYTYHYRYSKYGPDHHTAVGTVTLIR